MTQLVDELNEKYADLCLTYDEENDLLSMNTEQLQEYIEAQHRFLLAQRSETGAQFLAVIVLY